MGARCFPCSVAAQPSRWWFPFGSLTWPESDSPEVPPDPAGPGGPSLPLHVPGEQRGPGAPDPRPIQLLSLSTPCPVRVYKRDGSNLMEESLQKTQGTRFSPLLFNFHCKLAV